MVETNWPRDNSGELVWSAWHIANVKRQQQIKVGSSNLKLWAIITIITTSRVWAFSDNLGVGFHGFDLWDMPSQFLEGPFLFMILMSFSRAAQSFRGGKGSRGISRNKAAPTRHTACAGVWLLGKVTGRGHLGEANNTTAHFCKPLAHQQRDFFGFGTDY